MEGLLFPERGLIGGLDKIDWVLADLMVVRCCVFDDIHENNIFRNFLI